MKQHFFLIVVSAFVATIVVALASQFIDLPSFGHLMTTLSSDPNAAKENVLISSNS